MFFVLWFKRFFFSKNQFIRFTPIVSMFSLILASSSLVLAMSVYSGYETTIKRAITDMVGHLVITHRLGEGIPQNIQKKVKKTVHNKAFNLSFLSLKALLVYEQKLSGVLLEGISVNNTSQILRLKNRVIKGSFVLKNKKAAVIGRGIAKQFKLKLGDSFYIIIPKINAEGLFQKKHIQLYVEGIIDLGFHNFNIRHILVNINTVRSLTNAYQNITGMRLLIKEPKKTPLIQSQLIKLLGNTYAVKDSNNIISGIHKGYFQAVQREKFLIFFILMVLVVAGAFNVSSHLSISVLNQIQEISILKVMGASSYFIYTFLLAQGIIISSVGTLIGMGVGVLFSHFFVMLQHIWQIIPPDVYKVNMIITHLKWSDMLLIFFISQLICIISCLLPTWRALKLSLREGLLYE